jgi:hypothetical protein
MLIGGSDVNLGRCPAIHYIVMTFVIAHLSIMR